MWRTARRNERYQINRQYGELLAVRHERYQINRQCEELLTYFAVPLLCDITSANFILHLNGENAPVLRKHNWYIPYRQLWCCNTRLNASETHQTPHTTDKTYKNDSDLGRNPELECMVNQHSLKAIVSVHLCVHTGDIFLLMIAELLKH